MLVSRRGLIVGAASLLAAPAVVRASSLMPVKTIPSSPFGDYLGTLYHQPLAGNVIPVPDHLLNRTEMYTKGTLFIPNGFHTPRTQVTHGLGFMITPEEVKDGLFDEVFRKRLDGLRKAIECL